MTSDENPADVIEQAAQAITACIGPDRKWADCTPLLFARALHAAGLLADPADRDALGRFAQSPHLEAKWHKRIREAEDTARRLDRQLDEQAETYKRVKSEGVRALKRAERAEAEVAELEHRLGDCTCGPWHPDMDGPAEECPRHGRCYSDWVDAVDAKEAQIAELRATIDRVRGLADEWDRTLQDTLLVEINELRAALDGEGEQQ